MANYYDNDQPWSPGQPPSPDVKYPVDGYGGSLYLIPFKVPVYNPTESRVVEYMTWSNVDTFYQINAHSVLTDAIGFAICVVTLLNVIAITPSHKRRLPIYILLLLALIFQIFNELIVLLILFHSPLASAYVGLTFDRSSVVLSAKFKAVVVLSNIVPVLSFGFLQACLYIQGKSLLTWLKINHIRIYRLILVTLIAAGLVALVLDIVLSALQIVVLNRSTSSITDQVWQKTVFKIQSISATICICGWSLVNFSSSMTILHQRRRVLLSKNELIESALNFVTIVGLESFIIPIVLWFIRLIAAGANIPSLRVELIRLALACILLSLPIGSIFPSTRSQEIVDRDQIFVVTQDQNGNRHDLKQVERVRYDLRLNVSELSNSPPTPRTELSRKTPLDQFEIELEAIDGLGNILPTPKQVSGQKDSTDVDRIRPINASNESSRLL